MRGEHDRTRGDGPALEMDQPGCPSFHLRDARSLVHAASGAHDRAGQAEQVLPLCRVAAVLLLDAGVRNPLAGGDLPGREAGDAMADRRLRLEDDNREAGPLQEESSRQPRDARADTRDLDLDVALERRVVRIVPGCDPVRIRSSHGRAVTRRGCAGNGGRPPAAGSAVSDLRRNPEARSSLGRCQCCERLVADPRGDLLDLAECLLLLGEVLVEEFHCLVLAEGLRHAA